MNVHARTLNLFMHVYVCRCDSCQCISIIISAMIQSRIVLSIYVFCLSWQRREILSKSWWVASSISLFFFFFLHIDNKFKEGRCFNHNLLSFKILLYTLLEISLLIFFLLVYVFPFIKYKEFFSWFKFDRTYTCSTLHKPLVKFM